VAQRHQADVIVAEAMAIQPEYLWALEHFYIKATDLVITNVRPDHQEQLGPSPDAMADAITHCVPSHGRVFLATEAATATLKAAAATRKSEVRIVSAPGCEPEAVNTQLAVAVCHSYGIASKAAAEAMLQVSPDIGIFRIAMLKTDCGPLPFANAFACNDTVSLEHLWRHHQPVGVPSAFLLNPRSDRPIRTMEFLKLLARIAPDAVLFIASCNPALRRQALLEGFARERVHLVPAHQMVERLGKLASSLPLGTVLWGVGNYRGIGAELSAVTGESDV
jgi:poly-gamma-glutamate synthase PgsB/CapB